MSLFPFQLRQIVRVVKHDPPRKRKGQVAAPELLGEEGRVQSISIIRGQVLVIVRSIKYDINMYCAPEELEVVL